MADPRDLEDDDDGLSPAAKDPSEGPRGKPEGGDGPRTPGHLGPAGDPVEGKEGAGS